jgi:alpha-ketoglutarate-dependent taurine dioxygenase
MLQNPVLTDCERQSTEPSGWVCEVAGFDIAAGLEESELLAVRDEVLRHGAIVLREQYLTPDQHLAFTGRLAQVDHNPKRPAGKVHAPIVDGFPEIVIVSNIMKDGRPIGLTDAGLLWHSDTQSSATPELFVTLNATLSRYGTASRWVTHAIRARPPRMTLLMPLRRNAWPVSEPSIVTPIMSTR